MIIRKHDPQAKLDYGWDLTDWLKGDTLKESTWSVSPAGPTLSNPGHTDKTTIVWMEGCVLGVTYTLTNHFVTNGGRADDRSYLIITEQR